MPPCVERLDELHRRAEVGHVQAALEVARHGGVGEVDDDLAALRADVDADLAVGEIDDDAAFAAGPAAEVDVAQGVAAGRPGAASAKRCVIGAGAAPRLRRRSAAPASVISTVRPSICVS